MPLFYPEEEEEELSWEDELAVARFMDGDDFPPEEEDEDNPDPYRWPDAGDLLEADEYEDEDDFYEPGWISALEVYYRSQAAAEKPATRPAPQPAPLPAREPAAPTLSIEERKKRGLRFEEWVARQFPALSFKIIVWQSDKTIDGRIPLESLNPDFVFEVCRIQGVQFAVECKWRRQTRNGVFEWGGQREAMERYRTFARERRIPVFLVFGLGGSPDKPSEVYVIPLSKAGHEPWTLSRLAPFERERKGAFFYHRDTGMLL